MYQASRSLRLKNKRLGLVPTMGALHPGHLSLIRRARQENDAVIVSIFVNPAQFGPKEDFRRYPRPLRKDLALCQKEGVDFIFHPGYKKMYPRGFKTYVTVEDLSAALCGAFRPGHFRGVATVVAKLFNIAQPDAAYFGQKDAQQAIIVQRMAKDLNFPLAIKVLPTVREKDGLALSSRNIHLRKGERKKALALAKSLGLARALIQKGCKDPRQVLRRMRELLQRERQMRIDYVSIVDAETLEPVKKISGRCLVALACRLGKTRLIDNIVINKKNWR
jgi:pantoate--beta-alanine ligase